MEAIGKETNTWRNYFRILDIVIIMRLIERRKQNPGSEIPVRKKGTGPKKKWGRKEADAIERAHIHI